MRTDYINILSKVSKALHIEKISYRLCRLLPLSTSMTVSEAESYMASKRTDRECSCLREHNLPNAPKFDLQVIVAAYNAENYIEDCLQSVLSQQTEYSFCITIVNDGSTDHTASILNKYTKNPLVQVFSVPNGGPGAARNVALLNICAHYLTFLDADDQLAEGAIQNWLHYAYKENADIVEGSLICFSNGKFIPAICYPYQVGTELRLTGKAATRIYKSTCWQHFCFPTYWAEDNINWMLIYQQSKLKMVTLPQVTYLYRRIPLSQTTSSVTSFRRIDTYWGTKRLLKSALQMNIPFTSYYLECFIRQSCLNMHRIAIIGDCILNQSLFVSTCDLLEKYFNDVHTSLKKEHHIEMALREKNYKEFYLYSLFFV